MRAGTPAEQGFYMPAEWETHTATWLAWPHNAEDWPGKFEPIPWVYAEIIRALTQHERVRLLVRTAAEKTKVRKILALAGVNLAKVDFYLIPTDRVWTRDSGPTFLVRGTGKRHDKLLLDWKFNAWAKYPNHLKDDKVPQAIAAELGLPVVRPVFEKKGKPVRVVLEGGAIDVNGKGTLITTEECLLSKVQARNPALTRGEMEQVFAEYLGIRQVIWLGKGIVGDDTHGHVDDITRFVNATTVVTVSEPNPRDPNHSLLKENVVRLKKARDQQGRQLDVVELPMPRPVMFEGTRLPASYANFLIANKVVIVPTFNDANDRVALNLLAELFPGREIIGIHAVDLVWGLGTLHCLSQQEPA
jgi:agmatine deiminase